MKLHRIQGVAAGLVLSAAVLAFQATTSVTENGRTVTADVRNINGRLYVPLREVATYFGYTIRTQGSNVQLSRAEDPAQAATTPPDAPSPDPSVAAAPATQPIPATAAPNSTTPINGGLGGGGLGGSGLGGGGFGGGGFGAIAPPPPPAELTTTLGTPVSFNGYAYSVTSVTDVGGEYRQEFDQRRQTLRPRFASDKLVSIRMTVANVGSTSGTPPVPGFIGTTVFDDQRVGYPGSLVDARQASEVTFDGNPLIGVQTTSAPSVILASGGKFEYALIVSIPKDRNVSRVTFSLPGATTSAYSGGSGGAIDSGANVTINLG